MQRCLIHILTNKSVVVLRSKWHYVKAPMYYKNQITRDPLSKTIGKDFRKAISCRVLQNNKITWAKSKESWLISFWSWIKKLSNKAVCMHGMVVNQLSQGSKPRQKETIFELSLIVNFLRWFIVVILGGPYISPIQIIELFNTQARWISEKLHEQSLRRIC